MMVEGSGFDAVVSNDEGVVVGCETVIAFWNEVGTLGRAVYVGVVTTVGAVYVVNDIHHGEDDVLSCAGAGDGVTTVVCTVVVGAVMRLVVPKIGSVGVPVPLNPLLICVWVVVVGVVVTVGVVENVDCVELPLRVIHHGRLVDVPYAAGTTIVKIRAGRLSLLQLLLMSGPPMTILVLLIIRTFLGSVQYLCKLRCSSLLSHR
jgi:hypothetical protein